MSPHQGGKGEPKTALLWMNLSGSRARLRPPIWRDALQREQGLVVWEECVPLPGPAANLLQPNENGRYPNRPSQPTKEVPFSRSPREIWWLSISLMEMEGGG